MVKVSSDHNATVQFRTSQSDVYIKLSILDNEKEVISNQGKGHVIIPIYCFLANNGAYTNTHFCIDAVEYKKCLDMQATLKHVQYAIAFYYKTLKSRIIYFKGTWLQYTVRNVVCENS